MRTAASLPSTVIQWTVAMNRKLELEHSNPCAERFFAEFSQFPAATAGSPAAAGAVSVFQRDSSAINVAEGERPLTPLSNPEIEQDRDNDVDRRTSETTRLEAPFSDSFDSLLIEPLGVQRPNHLDLRRPTIAHDHELQLDRTLNSVEQRFIRVFGFDFSYHARCSHATARSVRAAADSAASSRTDTRSGPRPDTDSDAGTDAPAGSRTS